MGTAVHRTTGRGAVVVSTVVALLLAPAIGRAIHEWENEEGTRSLSLTGAERLVVGYLRYPEMAGIDAMDDDGFSASVTRLLAEGELGERLSYEGNFYLDLSRLPQAGQLGTLATVGSFGTPYRTRYLDWSFWQEGSVHGQLGVDRLYLRLSAASLDITVGRFPVNTSVTALFAPNDFFAPFAATAINKIYKPGVDALQLSLAPGALSTIDLIGVMGYGDDDAPGFGQSALLVRATTVWWNTEWALLGGKLAQRWVVGASIQGEIGPFGLRSEGHVGFPDHDGDGRLDDTAPGGQPNDKAHVHAALDLDLPIEWHNSSIGASYGYFSDGARVGGYLKRAQRFFPDDQLLLARHYAGLSAGTEIIPILRAQAAVLVNVMDRSGLGVVNLVYSISDEAECVVGGMVPWGKQPRLDESVDGQSAIALKSEFGAVPYVAFVETRFYF